MPRHRGGIRSVRKVLVVAAIFGVTSLASRAEAVEHGGIDPHLSVGPLVALEPARGLGLVGASGGIGIGDGDRDYLMHGVLLASTTPRRSQLPEGELVFGALLFGTRWFWPDRRRMAVRPFATLWFGAAGTTQGLARADLSLPALVVWADAGVRFSRLVAVSIHVGYAAPVPVAPIGLGLEVGLP